MNPFIEGSKDEFQNHLPSIGISPHHSPIPFGSLINPNYASSLQNNTNYYKFREDNYMRLVREASACAIPHTVIYHSQYIMDCILSQVKVEERYLSLLFSICLYVTSVNILPRFSVKILKKLQGYSYSSLLQQVTVVYKKDKKWLDYCIFFVMSKSDPLPRWKCPYTICHELLESIHFSQFQTFAEYVIDVLCSKDRSMSLSPHTLAYYSIVSLMKKYYGVHNGREPTPFTVIDKREHFLCLTMLSVSFPQLQDICIYMSSPNQSIDRTRNKRNKPFVPSPKSQFAETYFV